MTWRQARDLDVGAYGAITAVVVGLYPLVGGNCLRPRRLDRTTFMPIAAVLGSLLLGDTGAEAVIVTFRLGRAAEQRAATAAAKVQAMGMELNLEQRIHGAVARVERLDSSVSSRVC